MLLGDYVNYGPDSRGVLELLVSATEELGNRLVLLEGNHDRALLTFLRGGDLGSLLAIGGAPTVRSYVGSPRGNVSCAFRAAVPQAHRGLLSQLRPSWTMDGVLAIHKWPKAPIDRQARFVVLGHYHQQGGVPFIGDTEAYIDTGCGWDEDGNLTCLLFPERDWFVV